MIGTLIFIDATSMGQRLDSMLLEIIFNPPLKPQKLVYMAMVILLPLMISPIPV